MKKLLAILMALCILLSLVACNAGQAGGKEVTIRFWQAGGDTVGASTVMRMLLDKFEAANPGIKVEYQAIPWSNDPHVMFQTGIAGGDIADLLVVGSPLDFQLSNEDAVLPLDDLLSDAVKKDISPVLMTECTYTGSENEAM